MTQTPEKRIPTWLTIDVLVIVLSVVIIGIVALGERCVFQCLGNIAVRQPPDYQHLVWPSAAGFQLDNAGFDVASNH